jgi:hypothetical protein
MDEKGKNKDALDIAKSKFRFKINGIPFESDMPEIVIGPALTSKDELQELMVRVSDEVKKHDRMCYTTDVGTVGLIFENMTIRSSSLSNVKLNDYKEKERIGVSQFANGRFITCFSHIDHESVPFWAYYGGNDKTKKVLLKFENFARHIDECINMDYCLIADNKKLFFYSDEYKQTLNNNCDFGQMIGLPQINTDFNICNCIRRLEVLDVDYVSSDSDVFTTDFAGASDIDVSKFSSNSGQTVLKGIKTFKPDCLGRQKSNPWDYERESRILCCLDKQEFSEFMYIDLRLKQEMFRNLVIILSPWADDKLQSQLEDIIEKSTLASEIKKSIIIKHSELEGTLNL